MGRVIVAGAGRMTVPSATISLSSIAEGTVVKINEDDSPVEFYVSKQDYESGLNVGRTLMIRKNCYGNFMWDKNASALVNWVDSNAYTQLNITYLTKFSEKVQSLISTTSYYATYGKSSGTTNVVKTTSAIFLLSTSEYGLTPDVANVEGTALPISNLIKTATNDSGVAVAQWTRTRGNSSVGFANYLTTNGVVDSDHTDEVYYFRPAFSLPATAKFDPDTLILKE